MEQILFDGVAVHVLGSIYEVPAETWNALVGAADFYQSHEWLAVLERDNTARAQYLLAWLDGRLMGALPVYEIGYEGSAAYQPDRFRGLLRVAGDYLYVGARRCYHSEFLLAGQPPATADRVTAALARAALTIAARAGLAGIGGLYLPTATLRRLGRVLPVTAAFDSGESVIEGVGGGVEGYLSGCTSKLRAKIRREMRVFAATGWQTGVTPLADCLSEVALLVSKVEQRHGHSTPDFLLKRLLRRQAEGLATREVLLTCRDQRGGLVACSLNYAWRGTLYSRAVGLDYDEMEGSYAYFNMLIYQAMDYSSEHGLDRLQLGLASAAKVERGAVATPLWTAAIRVGTEDCAPGVELVDPDAGRRWAQPYDRYSHALDPHEWEPLTEPARPHR